MLAAVSSKRCCSGAAGGGDSAVEQSEFGRGQTAAHRLLSRDTRVASSKVAPIPPLLSNTLSPHSTLRSVFPQPATVSHSTVQSQTCANANLMKVIQCHQAPGLGPEPWRGLRRKVRRCSED